VARSTLDALRTLQAALSAQPEATHAELGAELGGLSRSRVANLVRVLCLPPVVLDLIWGGHLTPKHGEALVGLPVVIAERLARDAIAGKWSTTKLRDAAGRAKGRRGRSDPNADVDLARLESRLSEQLGAPVRIAHGPSGGELVLGYTNLDTLEGLLDRLGYVPE
jgi:ParB family transcriptional regulator, chromosome partitioning protein